MNDRFKFRYAYENKVYDAAKLDLLWEEVQVDKYDHVDAYSLALAPGKLLQCTGLKDKNGTLIYEGDIVKDVYNNLRIVEWNSVVLQYMANVYIYAIGDATFPMYLVKDLEVIGNIYENPELLSVRNEE